MANLTLIGAITVDGSEIQRQSVDFVGTEGSGTNQQVHVVSVMKLAKNAAIKGRCAVLGVLQNGWVYGTLALIKISEDPPA